MTCIFAFVALACTIIGFFQIFRLRGHDSTVIWLFPSIFWLGIAVSFVAFMAPVQRIESVVVPNLGRLVGNCSTMIAAWAMMTLLDALVASEGVGRQLAVRRRPLLNVSIVVAALTCLFLASPTAPPGWQRTGEFGELEQEHLTLQLYVVVYSVFLAIPLARMLVAWRYARHVRRRSLRCSLYLIAGGGLLGLVYLGHKLVSVLGDMTGWWAWDSEVPACRSVVTPAVCGFELGLPALAVLTMLVGFGLPAAVLAAAFPARQWRAAGAYRTLEPLWAALADTEPSILHSLAVQRRWSYEWRLQNRIVGIHDAVLALVPFRAPTPDGDVTDGQSVEMPLSKAAAREATALAAAMERKKKSGPDGAVSGDGFAVSGLVGDLVDLGDAVRWWSAVSAAMGAIVCAQRPE